MEVTEDKKRFECYMNSTVVKGSNSVNFIISGSGETAEEALELFDHALEAYREEKQ